MNRFSEDIDLTVKILPEQSNTKIKDFNYFKLDFNDELIQEFNNMQYKYVLDDKYKITMDYTKNVISEIYNFIKNFVSSY